MIDFLAIAFGCFLASSALLYLVWNSLRVSFLRQTLFEVRDDLWDTARSAGALSDPAYMQFREHLNALIDLCGLLSWGVLDRFNQSAAETPHVVALKSENPSLQKAIEHARYRANDAVVTSVLLHRATGWMFLLKIFFSSLAHDSINTAVRKLQNVRRGISSSIPEVFSPVNHMLQKH